MTMFTRRCSRQLKTWRSEFASSFKNFLLLILVSSFLIPAKLSAQGGNVSVEFQQGANKDAPFSLGTIHWINSILQSSNSIYAEGMSTLQRIVFYDMADVTNDRHVLQLKMEADKSGHHAYDFMTGWNQALKAALAISPSVRLMPDPQLSNASPLYDETEPQDLRVCGSNISATGGTVCDALHDGVKFDLSILSTGPSTLAGQNEGDHFLAGDEKTVAQEIAAYEAAFGDRTIRVWTNAFIGAENDADNFVEFVKYDAGYIFYNIHWRSHDNRAVIEYGAHIARGQGGYGVGQGASDINGGPYHTILVNFLTGEGNLGNQDNQLQGADIVVIPECNITGGQSTVCAGSSTNLTFNAHPINLDGATFSWVITKNQTGASIVGSSTDSIVVVNPGTTPGCDSLRFIVTNSGGPVGALSDTCWVTWCVICPTPTIGSPGAAATINCTQTPTFTPPTGADACGGATVNNLGDVTGGNSCTRTITRRWDVSNACGNHSGTVSQTITIIDNIAPTIGSAGAAATINCTATPSFTPPTATDACNGATVNNLGDVTGGTGCARTVTRRWDATDACGNHSATVSQTITIVDNVAPNISSAGANATINCTAAPSFTPPTASDACDGATVNNLGDVTSGTTCNRTITRRWDATDACGNHSATVSQSITITDNVPPTIGSPGAAATINCTATPSFTPPTAEDFCNGATVNNLGDVTGGNSCNRTITRRWDATDACGNHSATVSQTITVVDNVGPTIGSAGAAATINCTATPSFTPPTASDACNGATVNNLGDVTGGNSCNRTITRRWDATDACGNHSATVSQTITVVDDVAPTIGGQGAAATINCTATPSFTPPTANDACNGATVNNLGDVTGGNSCARTITRRWDATDACGNHSATVSQTITVVDNVGPTISGQGAAATINCTATPSFTPPTASDACDGATVNNLGDVTGGNSCNRTVTRRWDATDACGNHSATVSQTITVIDNVAPTIGGQGAGATINCTATPSFTPPTANDACNGATVNNLGDVTGGNSCNRTVTRRWDATDACGNHSATVSQTITIIDNVPPTIGQPGANATIQCPAVPTFTPPTASDACNGATVNLISDVTVAGSTPGSFTETRTWDATDACGNHSATVSQQIVVECNPTEFCTFTQGFWGNKNGLAYMRDSGLLTTPIIIGSTAAGKMSILIPAGSWETVNSIMPGGSTPGPLTTAGQCSILNACFDAYLTKQGKINNILLSQTIALSLNVRVTNTILGLPTIPADKCLIIEGDTIELNQNVVDYLICKGTANVAGLLALANDLLGGVLTPGQNVGGCIVPSYGDVTEIIGTFNEAFDECRTFTGFGNCTPIITVAARTVVAESASAGLTVSSYPNPYTDQIRFVLQSRTTGRGSLEVYNMLGQKIQTVYQGTIYAGRGQVVNYNVPVLNRTNLIYLFKVGDKQVTGKLLNIR